MNSILGVLQVLLIALKLMGLISISWWAVFIPTFIFIPLFFLLLFIAAWAEQSKPRYRK